MPRRPQCSAIRSNQFYIWRVDAFCKSLQPALFYREPLILFITVRNFIWPEFGAC